MPLLKAMCQLRSLLFVMAVIAVLLCTPQDLVDAKNTFDCLQAFNFNLVSCCEQIVSGSMCFACLFVICSVLMFLPKLS